MFLLSKNSKLAFLGAIPDPLYEIGSLFSILTIAKQSPPIPVELGSTTDKQIDAAIAANAVLGLVEPTGCGIGGDLFAIVWSAEDKKLYGLNSSGPAPKNISIDKLREEGIDKIPPYGALLVTVPGAVAGWNALHSKFGSLDFELLLSNSKGVAVFSGTVFGLFGKLFDKGKFTEIDETYSKIKKTFDDRFYIEIQRHNDQNEIGFEKFNLKKSLDLEIPIIATNEVFYLDKEMHEAHDALICIGNKTYVNEKNRLRFTDQHYLKTNSEMSELFADLPEALENNYNFPLRCSYRPLFSNPILPNISSDKDGNADEILKKDSIEGLKVKFNKIFNLSDEDLENNDSYREYKNRLNHELSIIVEMKYSSYFLIVADYIKWAKNNDIPVGPGRGSGAGSLVAWCLSITDVDPIKFNLIFERFLNPERVSMPDIDIDFEHKRREEVIQYIYNRYGTKRAALTAATITYKKKSAIRDVGKSLGIPPNLIKKLSINFYWENEEIINPKKIKLFIRENFSQISKFFKGFSKYEIFVKVYWWIKISNQILNFPRHLSQHVGGFIISSSPLSHMVPIENAKMENRTVIQWNKYDIEELNILKIDILGLGMLSAIQKSLFFLKEKNKFLKSHQI